MCEEKRKSNYIVGKACCFFGHQDTCLRETDTLKKEIEKLILEKGVKTFFMGGYGNFDSYALNSLKEIKKENSSIKIISVIAYLSKLESYISNVYDETLCPEGLETVPKRFAITYRNRWMVEHTNFIIAYVNRSYGGAYTAIKHGKNKKIPIINLSNRKVL